ncbi:aldose epimerase family protein [Algoriphagus sediminis]|uniref:Aldose 1-epimerase n=1 Tax=Algoriphagus sediminis TaxID=3057113 RepID=A0ABT7Y8R2_9BACT|nr:aldose epimerase family protein [Algoriphagus sediminis]MDN3202908.1 aldose epimerase family protein [Algoriphagus sediminis]
MTSKHLRHYLFSKITIGLCLFTSVNLLSCEEAKVEIQELDEQEKTLMIKQEKVAEHNGEDVMIYVLENQDMKLELSNYGGLVYKIWVPDREGNLENVALTMENVEDFLSKPNPFFGATAGRVANRIGGASFTLDGETYTLARNNGQNTLHGGLEGFNKKVWSGEIYELENEVGVKMVYVSPDGEEGFPGELTTTMYMGLTENNELRIRFEATTDKSTIVNLTNHTYFNLGGIQRDVLDHLFTFHADAYTPVDDELIPTGEIKDVNGTAFDFRVPKLLGDQIKANGEGFDHNMIMKLEPSSEMEHFVTVLHPESGRKMEMYSDNVGVQFYTGNFINEFEGAGGKIYEKHWGFCLESQNWPDAINHENFPSPILRPGEKYTHEIIYRFSTE